MKSISLFIVTLMFSLALPLGPSMAQLVVGLKPQKFVSEVPEIFHGTWRITGSFHVYDFVVPEDFIGKTITITDKGYQLGSIICTPEKIGLNTYDNDWVFNYKTHNGITENYRHNYTSVHIAFLKCQAPSDDFFTKAVHKIEFRHYGPDNEFIAFVPLNGPEFIMEKTPNN